MSKLQILIPQYNEDEAVIQPLLDSIEFQYNIDLKNDIEVFIGNDGSDTKLSIEFLKKYTFPIQYHYFKHGGLAATRYKLQNLATADYIMFCDADDRFINTIALSSIFLSMQVGFDYLMCDFMEETSIKTYVLHSKDPVFIHGKVYRRQFLLDNKIQWHPELHEHQDSAYNVLVLVCSKDTKVIKNPLYLWHFNEKSICRKNRIYHLPNTWTHMIDSYQALVNDLKDRGYSEQACYYAKYCLYATYYEMSHQVWSKDEVSKRRLATYKRLLQYYNTNELLIKKCNQELTKKMIEITQKRASMRGSICDMPPFEEWLEAILKIFK